MPRRNIWCHILHCVSEGDFGRIFDMVFMISFEMVAYVQAMARPLRIEYPDVFYHVMNRGNAGQDPFRIDDC